MAKRKPLKRKKNPHNPTAKENLISAINTGCVNIGSDIRSSTVQFGLENMTNLDLQEVLGAVDRLLLIITDLKNTNFKFYGEKAGLK